MQYRPFGSTDFSVSALGFGCMRFPTCEDGSIDRPQTIEMLRHAIDQGVNYLDTAYPYHGGESEGVVAEALQDGYREKVKIADKLPLWMVDDEADVDRLLDEQIARLGGAFIDFYLIHNVSRGIWGKVAEHNIVKRLEAAQAAGKIGKIGFSFHDGFDLFKEAIDSYDWDFVQIQYNYMNENVQAGTPGLEYAASKGIPVVIMEPLLGGCLVNPPEEVCEALAADGKDLSPVDRALLWLWNKPEVTLVLSGMSAMEHVVGNLAAADRSGVGKLGAETIEAMKEAAKIYKELTPIPCTRCRYCLPCPQGVDIPELFSLYNGIKAFKGNQGLLNRIIYNNLPAENKADSCVSCGLCEKKCPQSIKISELMPEVGEFLSRPPSAGE